LEGFPGSVRNERTREARLVLEGGGHLKADWASPNEVQKWEQWEVGEKGGGRGDDQIKRP